MKRNQFMKYSLGMLIVSLVLGLGACSKKPKADQDAAGDTSAIVPTDVTGEFKPGQAIPELPAVYFAYDSFSLTAASKKALDAHAEFLKSKSMKVQVEGHCDERGTTEYNLALGEKRATVVRDYLVKKGVSADTLNTISYGEERPSAQGDTESVWAKNRRAEFVTAN